MIKPFRFVFALATWLGPYALALAADSVEAAAVNTAPAAIPARGGAFDHGILWQIDNGRSAPSFLLGTMHVDDARITHLPEPVQRAFDASASLTTEALLDLEQILEVGSELLILDGNTLEGLIGSDLFQQVQTALRDRGFMAEVANLLQPWAVALLLSQPPPRSGMFLDRQLYQLAQQRGKPVYGLETIKEQLDAFKSMTLEDQITLLKETLAQLNELPELTERLIQTYLDRDLGELSVLANRQFSPSPVQQRLKQRLLSDRNERMFQRMQPRLEEGNAFVAVGALHLTGPNGLLQMLQDQGCSVTRIY